MIYGNPIAGDGLYNIRVGLYGIQVSFRFIQYGDAEVDGIRHFNAYSNEKPGYHAGNGGKIKIELRSDKNGNPSDKILATAILDTPLEISKFPLTAFDQKVKLDHESVYHIVFSNVGDKPEENYVSVNTMAVFCKPSELKVNHFLEKADMTVLFKSKYNDWQKFGKDLLTPIFTLCNGNIPINGYGGVESWISETKLISMYRKVRQWFIPKNNMDITGVYVRLGKSGNPTDLVCSVVDSKQRVISQGRLPSLKVKTISTEIVNGYRLGHDWVFISLGKPAKVKGNKPYAILLENQSFDPYEIFPLRDGANFGFFPVWANSTAEYTNDGQKWVGWDAWGKPNQTSGKLQLCLEVDLTNKPKISIV